jgi:hypothetical protein
MNVIAFAAAVPRDWRWRIVNHAGEVVQESSSTFPTIAAALAAGKRQMLEMNVVDRSVPASPVRRSTSHLRPR